MTTGAGGTFSFANVPETTAGELDVYLPGGNFTWKTGLTFTAAGPNVFALQPGRTNVALIDDWDDGVPDWSSPMPVDLSGSGGRAFTWLSAATGTALATAPDVDYGVIYPYLNRGIEAFPSPAIGVTPGVTNGSIEFNESEARDIFMKSPYWASGNPGRPARVSLYNWPAGYTVRPTGYSVSPKPTVRTWGAFTTTGSTMTRKLTIPSNAPSGYTYYLVFSRQDSGSMMQLEVPYQVAKLRASRTSIRKGNRIRLSGRIPTVGHWGSKPGKKKYVLLYKRARGYPPNTWDARKRGWTKVRFYQANGYGYFKTGYFRPKRTTRYIVRYPGDSQYYRGYTSMIKVRVR